MDGINMGIGNAHRENGYMKCGKCAKCDKCGKCENAQNPEGMTLI